MLAYKYKPSSTILSPQFFLFSLPLPSPFYYYFFHSFRNIFTVDTACTIGVKHGFQNAGNYSEIDGLTMSVPVARRPLCQVREVFNNYEGSPSSAIHHRHRHRIFENGRISEQDIRVPTMRVIWDGGGGYKPPSLYLEGSCN